MAICFTETLAGGGEKFEFDTILVEMHVVPKVRFELRGRMSKILKWEFYSPDVNPNAPQGIRLVSYAIKYTEKRLGWSELPGRVMGWF